MCTRWLIVSMINIDGNCDGWTESTFDALETSKWSLCLIYLNLTAAQQHTLCYWPLFLSGFSGLPLLRHFRLPIEFDFCGATTSYIRQIIDDVIQCTRTTTSTKILFISHSKHSHFNSTNRDSLMNDREFHSRPITLAGSWLVWFVNRADAKKNNNNRGLPEQFWNILHRMFAISSLRLDFVYVNSLSYSHCLFIRGLF